jgi:muramoyltetrapeptide carboxypeptidase LdcA involved in peptidoglycan recycling
MNDTNIIAEAPTLNAEQRRVERNKRNTERIKHQYQNDETFRQKMKDNSKRRYARMKDLIALATNAGLSLTPPS